jgi:hypothetical protein
VTALADTVARVLSARTHADLFAGTDPAREYRRLARMLHPDLVAPADRAAANTAFVHLTDLWGHRYGPVLRTRHGEYRLGRIAHTGDLADLYDVGGGQLLKLPRRPANNDLMDREADALRTLACDGDPRYLPYVPRLVDSFRHRDPDTGAERRVTVLGSTLNLHPLTTVRRAYPTGLDPRDAAWMWRRLLVALGFAHRAGVVHGAVLPTHVLIEPVDHGVVLVDWCYSSRGGAPVPALVPDYTDWYPREVRTRQEPGPGTDIAMAARCMTDLMGDRAPQPLRTFAAGCQPPALRQRPDDAWRLLGELDEMLERLYGPRRFRPFSLTT